MNTHHREKLINRLYYRLIVVWIICETLVGGVVHTLNYPLLKTLTPCLAMICISLIGYFIPKKGAILQATLIVILFKLLINPSTALQVYFAIFIQGIFGQILFSRTSYYKLSCVILGVLALTTSALQRIFVLFFLYKNGLDRIVGEFSFILPKNDKESMIWWISLLYLSLHSISGIFLGLLASRVIKKLKKGRGLDHGYIIPVEKTKRELKITSFKKKMIKIISFALLVSLIAIYIISAFSAGFITKETQLLLILIRFGIMILFFNLMIDPLWKAIIKYRSARRNEQSVGNINTRTLSNSGTLVDRSWQLSAEKVVWTGFIFSAKYWFTIAFLPTINKRAKKKRLLLPPWNEKQQWRPTANFQKLTCFSDLKRIRVQK